MSKTESLLNKFQNETLELNEMLNLKGGQQTIIDGKTACIDRITTDNYGCSGDAGFHCQYDTGEYRYFEFITAKL
jgi:hypothetical protein